MLWTMSNTWMRCVADVTLTPEVPQEDVSERQPACKWDSSNQNGQWAQPGPLSVEGSVCKKSPKL